LTHAEFVRDLLSTLTYPTDPATTIALAQVHATMALVDAIDGWQPLPPPEPDPLPVEQTRAGWRWEVDLPPQ
jgi:hypothetical protein